MVQRSRGFNAFIHPLISISYHLITPHPAYGRPLPQGERCLPTRPQTVMQPTAPLDPEKAAEGLSMLRPQAQQSKIDGYDKRQQSELDRLIETSE
jgi:hypothetical protein